MRKPSFICTSILLLFLTVSCNPAPVSTGKTVIPITIVPTHAVCTTVLAEPTPGPNTLSPFPLESETDYVRGAKNPIVTITVYSDYQAFVSALFEKESTRLLETYSTEVRIVNRSFPMINNNDKAALAAQAAEAAAEQNKFQEMHALLFAQQQNWVGLTAEDFEQWLTAQAAGLGMNVDQFKTDLKRQDIVARVQQAWENGQKVGVISTPFILINGQVYSGPQDYRSLSDIIQMIALGKRQYTSCPDITIQSNKEYIATLHTTKGDVVIELFADKTPMTVNSFLFLARSGWYDNIMFYHVVPDLYALTGDPSGTGMGHPGYYVITEIDPSLTFNKPGMVAMINSGLDTSGSQFFITYAPMTEHNGRYTIFGQVLKGMNVLKQLTPRDPQAGGDIPAGDQLLSVTIEEK